MRFFKALMEEELENDKLIRYYSTLDCFLGSLEEYNGLKGEKHYILDTGVPVKPVVIDSMKLGFKELNRDMVLVLKDLMNRGCVGLIRYDTEHWCDWSSYRSIIKGIPVGKVQGRNTNNSYLNDKLK